MKYLYLLLIFSLNQIFSFSQEVSFPLNPSNKKIQYCKSYESPYRNKLNVEKKWISEEFNCPIQMIIDHKNRIRFLASKPIFRQTKDENRNLGELSFLIQVLSKEDKFLISISKIVFIKLNEKDSIPLDKIFNDQKIEKRSDYSEILDLANSHFESLINSFEYVISPYLRANSDYIILKETHDTIKCKIFEEKITSLKYKLNDRRDNKTYTITNDNFDYYIKQSLSLASDSILSYLEFIPNINDFKRGLIDFRDWRFLFNLGFSYRTAPLAEDISSNLIGHVTELRKGIGFSTNLHYGINKYVGIGAAFIFAHSGNSIDNVRFYERGIFITSGRVSEKINVTCIAPSINVQEKVSRNIIINYTFYGGYLNYYNKMVVINQSVIVSGNTGFIGSSLGFDYKLQDPFAIGFSISYIYGLLSEFKVGNYNRTLPGGGQESLGRIEFNFGFRSYF